METNISDRAYMLDVSLVSVINDMPGQSQRSLVLESYFNDLYKLMVRKLAEFECQSKVFEIDTKRLRSLLEELIKVKSMISGREQGMAERATAK